MLEQFLSTGVFAYTLIFCRVGSGVMMMSGIGESFVPPRIRLLFALSLSALLLPLLQNRVPPMPASVFALFTLMAGEIVIGLYLGLASRVLITATHTAGTIIAQQVGMASAVVQDITTLASQSTVMTNLLSVTVLVLFFATDMDHTVLSGLAMSYGVFTPGAPPPLGGLAQQFAGLVSHTFAIAMHLAAPHIVIGMILYLGAGVLARLMPTMQIFFVLMAPQIMIGLFVLMVILPAMMLWYMGQLQNSLGSILPF